MPALIEAVRSHYDSAVANKILGSNVIRVFEALTGG
jgi:hypothetical protein